MPHETMATKKNKEQLAVDNTIRFGAGEDHEVVAAIAQGDIEAAEKMVKCADISKHIAAMETALHTAASAGHANICYLILNEERRQQRRFTVSLGCGGWLCSPPLSKLLISKSSGATTSLHRAAANGHARVCLTLLEFGAVVDARDSHGRTPLFLAAEDGYVDVCTILVNHGAAIDGPDSAGTIPFMRAFEGGHTNVCNLLHNRGSKVNLTGENGRRMITKAIEQNHIPLYRFLVEKSGMNVHETNDAVGRATMLHITDGDGHVSVCKLQTEHSPFKLERTAQARASVAGTQPPQVPLLDTKTAIPSSNVPTETSRTTLMSPSGRSDYGTDCNTHGKQFADTIQIVTPAKPGTSVARIVTQETARMSPDDDDEDFDEGDINNENGNEKYDEEDDTVIELTNIDAMIASPESVLPPENMVPDENRYFKESVFEATGAVGDQLGPTELHNAALKGDLTSCCSLVESLADVSALDDEGKTPLHYAARGGHIEVCSLLLDWGADIEAADEYGRTAVHIAAAQGHADLCAYLVSDRGASVHSENCFGRTALHTAASSGKLQVCSVLLEKGAYVKTNGGSSSPLHLAAEGNFVDICRLLLDRRADVHCRDSAGRTALHCASASGSVDAVSLLLERGALIQAKNYKTNETALHCAAEYGHAVVCAYLLTHGADASATGPNEETALHAAARCGHISVCNVLLNRRVDLEARDAEGKSPLMVASGQMNEHATEICKLMIWRGAQVSAKSSSGSAALLEAVRVGNVDVARMLIQVGMANISDANGDRNTALHIAALEGHLEICELLLDELANVEASGCDGQKPLHCAAQRDSVDICQLLVRAGADVEGKDKHNKTPLHVAVECGSLEVCQYLIEECSANVEAAFMMYGSAQTVLHLAATETMKAYLTQVVKKRQESPRNLSKF